MKNKCFVCGLAFQNSKENFEKRGNCCVVCDRFLEKISHKTLSRDKVFLRSIFSKSIIQRTINQ